MVLPFMGELKDGYLAHLIDRDLLFKVMYWQYSQITIP